MKAPFFAVAFILAIVTHASTEETDKRHLVSNQNRPGLGGIISGIIGNGFGQPGHGAGVGIISGQGGHTQGIGGPGFGLNTAGGAGGGIGSVSGSYSGSSGSCRYWCRTPQGQAYCCEGSSEPASYPSVKQGICPPVRPQCPPVRGFRPPATCSNDSKCPGAEKCCFDTCLQQHTCKYPVY